MSSDDVCFRELLLSGLRSASSRGETTPAFRRISSGAIVDLYRSSGDVDLGARASRALLTIGSSPLAGQRRARVPCAAEPMRIERKRFVRGH